MTTHPDETLTALIAAYFDRPQTRTSVVFEQGHIRVSNGHVYWVNRTPYGSSFVSLVSEGVAGVFPFIRKVTGLR